MRPQVFKVAKALAPSVIYIDEVETVRRAARPRTAACAPGR